MKDTISIEKIFEVVGRMYLKSLQLEEENAKLVAEMKQKQEERK